MADSASAEKDEMKGGHPPAQKVGGMLSRGAGEAFVTCTETRKALCHGCILMRTY